MAKKTKEVLEPLGFTRDQIVALFKAAKVSKSPQKETNEFLVEKLAELTTEIDDDDLAALEEADEESFDVATAVFEAIEKGQQVVIIEAGEEADEDEDEVEVEVEVEEDEDDDEEADETPAPKKGKSKASAKPEPKKKGKGKVPAKPEPKKGKGKGKVPAKEKAEPKAPRSKGVIYHVVKYLSQGTETKPVTKAKIIAALVPKFKDRTEEAMTVTVNSQINGQLKANKGMVLGKKKMKDGSNGYWIEDIGSFVLE
jgi:hypothetical protein